MLDRRIAPPFNRDLTFHLLTPTPAFLPNGLPVYFVSGGDQDVIKIEFVLQAGRWSEPKWGVSYFTTNLLSKGSRERSSFEIASAFDQLGAHLDVTSGMDFVTISLYCLTRTFRPALDLLLEILYFPTFPSREIDQLKTSYLQNLKINQEKTSFLASRLFRKALFGAEHPYGKELDEEEVTSLSQEDFKSFHEAYFGNFLVMVTGKIEDANRDAIQQALASLTLRPAIEKHHAIAAAGDHEHHMEKPGSVQSSLRAGRRAIPRSHEDYPKVFMVNHLLGGYFGSRLMKNIREDKGLTYGIHSSLHTMKHDSYLIIGADVNKENRSLAFSEIRKELNRLCNEMVPAEELDTARYHFIGSLQNEMSTTFAHSEKIRNILLYGLADDHYHKLIKTIANLQAEDIIETANRYFSEASFLEISAG